MNSRRVRAARTKAGRRPEGKRPKKLAFWEHEDYLAYHLRQFDQPYRSTVHLAQYLRETIRKPGGDALDVACGAGANIFHLSKLVPGYRWTGTDIAGKVTFAVGRPKLVEAGLKVKLLQGDFYKLTETVRGHRFDLVLCLQTIMAIPRYEPLLEQLLAVTRGWLFVSSLFTSFDVDVLNRTVDYTRPKGAQRGWQINIFGLRRFRDFCRSRGALEIVEREFEIDLDLEPPESGGLNSYTRKDEAGRRLLFTGPIYQPWRFVGIRMGEA